MRTKVQCKAIQAKGLRVNDVLLDMGIGNASDHVVRNARRTGQSQVN
jgi:hypothetical protein